uniref:Uncharacterized protein n=1 Tax=Myoviridae sp. ct6F13 TaxID=2827602 RepID=A0A8S5LJ25_9CAUD|nr:MAG TPA: hypothetical protein [Myoviridae sp. ct6F13]
MLLFLCYYYKTLIKIKTIKLVSKKFVFISY